LEVTAQNSGALRLYSRLGFKTVKTVYKAVELAYAWPPCRRWLSFQWWIAFESAAAFSGDKKSPSRGVL